ncbi:protein kinase domain-containing protein [Pendulispora albinea]|uniref:non-specific serine/threonine protein kinase n=1 Tax=Pendulispora albinea TaxID=2741071 RepID=A0ABZ2MBH7_9BACT
MIERVLFAGRFVIEKEAGRGGMGIVHRAFDEVTARRVALKVLHRTEPSTLRRFAVEADALERLDHPDIVRYVAHGVAEGNVPYLALEWIEGESLRAHVTRAAQRGERLAVADVVELGQRLAGALEAAHALGIVHRDVKPSNILLVGGSPRRPKLVDFGIVRAGSVDPATTTGALLGTVGYMAPEQARGAEHLDGRADLFSLGCVLFRCLANRDAFDGPNPVSALSMLLMHKPPRLAGLRPDVPSELDDLIAGLLAKEPEKRPGSASLVKRELARIGARLLDETQTSNRHIQWSHTPNRPPKGGERPSRSSRPSMPSMPSAASAPSTSARRRPLWLGAIGVAVVVLGAGFALRPWRHTLGFARAAGDAGDTAAASAPAATSLTVLPASPSCSAEGVAFYQQGMHAVHEGRWDRAIRIFEEAAEVDPQCPQIQFRRLLTSREQSVPLPIRRERLREALRLRDGLSERDRRLLDASEILNGEDAPRREEAVRIGDELVRRYPMDAEIFFLSGGERMNLARTREDLEVALERVRRASELDPTYSDAWQTQSRILEQLGRDAEARAALEQCLAMSPGSVDCMTDRVFALRRAGQCTEAAAEARRASSWEPEEAEIYRIFAETLTATRAPKEAIEQVLLLREGRLPAEVREETALLERAQLEAWAGQFDRALATTAQLEQKLAGSAAREPHWAAAMLTADALIESGDRARGARVAEQALLRKDAWTPDKLAAVSVAPTEAWLLATALRGGRTTQAAWLEATRAWERANERELSTFERWVLSWGAKVGSPQDAAEAMAHAPAGELRGGGRHFHVEWAIGLPDVYAGRIYLQAGDAARAASVLEAGARACQGMYYPFLNVRAHLWLGMAKEKLGDKAAACRAYGVVLDRWGHATPRSITAREADERSRALGCGASHPQPEVHRDR